MDARQAVTWLVFLGGFVLTAHTVHAQDQVPSLQDLVGARGASGEQALEDRGYNWIRTEKSGGASYSYWQESENGQCVAVRTADGRYASIVYAPPFDCQQRSQHPSATSGPADAFKTICGVFVDGKNYSYRCMVEDHYQNGRKTWTILRFPDQALKMIWKAGKQVELHFEGMVPKSARYAIAEGETNFIFEGKTYYYYSDKERARFEVEHFQDSQAVNDGGGAPAGASGESGVEPTTETERVRFSSGTTGTELTGTLTPGSSIRYVLGAKKMQDLYVRVAAKDPDLHYQILNPDGTFLLDQMPSTKEYRGQLWQSGDHVIEVINRGQRTQSYNVIFGVR